jgi:transcriptional regulator with GAF, ATPase, and Fis domain
VFKTIDLRPVRVLEKSELIERVYSLSDENKMLKDKIEQLRKSIKPKAIYVKKVEIVYIDRFNVADKNIDKSKENEDRDIGFCCDLFGVTYDLILEKGKGVRGMDRVSARSCISYVLKQRNYTSREVAKILNMERSSVTYASLRYRMTVAEIAQMKVSCYLKDYYNIDDNLID